MTTRIENTATDTIDLAKSSGADIANDVTTRAPRMIDQVRDTATRTLAGLQSAYGQNPTRTVTVGVLSLAGILAILATLTRR